ncbi:hypothetical protein SEA_YOUREADOPTED_57 [Mycobacterium phage YoureAdopted]|nr:hypothetical protein SEA_YOUREADOPTED_57 [Mycobacterium phage YoureAdopted]
MAFNWAGQRIEPGAIVWRGGRDGNTSSFKVGRVEAVDRTARVRWVAEMDWRGNVRLLGEKSIGRPNVDSLALIDPATLSDRVREALQQ